MRLLKKNKPVKRAPLPGEEGNGRKQVMIQGRLHHQDVSEKVGKDGIIETHVNYTHTEKNYYGKAKDRFCGACLTWTLKNYKEYRHKSPCEKPVRRRK